MEKHGEPIVYVVDDDADVRDGLMALFEYARRLAWRHSF